MKYWGFISNSPTHPDEKNMKKNLLFSLLVLSLIIISSVPVFAQSGLSIRDVHGRLTERRTFEPTNIAVEEAKYTGVDIISSSDSILLRNCTVILQNDLDFSPYFKVIPVDTFFMRHMELKWMTPLSWKRLGVSYVVNLEVEFPRDKIRVQYRLVSTSDEREIEHERFEANRKAYRDLIHEVANSIVNFLTGDKGIYRTKIVYCKKVGEASELYMSDYDGYNERQLTDNGSINLLPAFSPDGKYIYFTSYMDGDPKIYMLTLDNNQVDLISGRPGLNTAPAVSPDGNTIACVLTKDGNSEIYLLDRKGNIKKRLTYSRSIETSPTWSPDGKMIAFTSDRAGSPQIYIMDSEGLNVRRLTYQGGYNDSPCWSPGGETIIFASMSGGFNIASIKVNGADFRILADLGNNENPHFSPDGNHIVFSSARLGKKEIYAMDLFGNNMQRITKGEDCSNPAWSPFRE
jgi:TolB protein